MSKQQKILVGTAGLVILVAIIVVFLFWPKSSLAPTQEITPQEVVEETVGSFDPDDPMSFMEIQKIIDLGDKAVDPLLDLVDSPNIADQWAAVVGLSALRGDMDQQEGIAQVLRNMYLSEFLTIRLYAAASNGEYGDLSGVPVLLAALESGEIMSYMEPPTPVSVFANQVLERVSGQDMGFDEMSTPEEVQEVLRKWDQWWKVKQMEGNL